MSNYEHNMQSKNTLNLWNYHGETYYGTSEGTFKQRCENHKKSFKHENDIADTELLKEYWRLEEIKVQPQIQFYNLERCRPTKRTGICYLCLNENDWIPRKQPSKPEKWTYL